MSVWKKASKAHQKVHRERHQPEERKHLGLLEKKQDYVKRARDFNEKRDTLKLLRKRALNRNPDEFYHHMINAKVEDGMHFERDKEEEHSAEQLKLMRTQDLRYVTTKRTEEQRRIRKLQSQLHMISVDRKVKNKHLVFPKNLEVDPASKSQPPEPVTTRLSDDDLRALKETTAKTKAAYKELAKRIKRERELAVIQQKFEVKRSLESGRNKLKPKCVQKGTADSAPVYEWRYERKR